jgi:hypothetical protein
MAQVGHADESTTLRIYAKVLRRDRRHVGEAVERESKRSGHRRTSPPSGPTTRSRAQETTEIHLVGERRDRAERALAKQ